MENRTCAFFGYSKENADEYRSFIRSLIMNNGYSRDYTNVISLKRDKYLITAVLDESVNDEGYHKVRQELLMF